MDDSKLRALLVLHEGVVPYAYQDSLGYWTIGVGHLIDKRVGGKLPDMIVEGLLDYDLACARVDLFSEFPWARQLDDVRQAALIDMTFNLGIGKLKGFKNTLAAFKEGRWDDAAKGMMSSKWAGQVGKRADRLAEMTRSGAWPSIVLQNANTAKTNLSPPPSL